MLLYKDIVKEKNKCLHVKCSEVQLPLSIEDASILSQMNEYLVNSCDEEFCKSHEMRAGIGLAAPQIGVTKKMFVIYGEDEKGNLHHFGCINPKIISESVELTYLDTGEGCLSIDRVTEGYVHRPKRITVQAYLYNFDTKQVTFEKFKLANYMAVVFQHEYDHLQGILFIDKINKENPFFIPQNSSAVIFNSNN